MARARIRKPRNRSNGGAALPAGPAKREVIDGITVSLNGRELAVRVAERIRWHRERGDTLIAQMKKLSEVERIAAEDLVMMLGRYESPRVLLEKRLREHQERATFLAFIRDHIAPDAIYRLDSADLRMIDVIPG